MKLYAICVCKISIKCYPKSYTKHKATNTHNPLLHEFHFTDAEYADKATNELNLEDNIFAVSLLTKKY